MGFLPRPGAPLRTIAARLRGLHPRSRQVPDRRTPDQLPRRPAAIRGARSKRPGRTAPDRAQGLTGTRSFFPIRLSARPSRSSRRCERAGERSCATPHRTRDPSISSRSFRRWGRSSRSTSTVSPGSRAWNVWAASTIAPSPDRIEAGSWACARSRPAATSIRRGPAGPMMTFLNVFRKVGGCLRHRRRRHPVLHPGRPLDSIVPRDGCPSGFHDRLAAAARWSRSRRPAACRSCTRRSMRTAWASPPRSLRWEPGSRSIASASAGLPCRFQQANYQHSVVVWVRHRCGRPRSRSPDLRGDSSYLIAALAADGTSKVHGTG